jgi:glycine cleavage system transcriptional repressor
MRRWFILSAIGKDRPGLVAELARLVLEAEANLEDSRMTILGTDFAVILLCSSASESAGDRLAIGAKRLEREHSLTILLRHLRMDHAPRCRPRAQLYRVEAFGEDRAGIVAAICGVLAEPRRQHPGSDHEQPAFGGSRTPDGDLGGGSDNVESRELRKIPRGRPTAW